LIELVLLLLQFDLSILITALPKVVVFENLALARTVN